MLFPFPYDRKLPALPALAPGSPVLENLLGTPVTPRLVSYAAEQSAAAACVDERRPRARVRQGPARRRRAARDRGAGRPGRRARAARTRAARATCWCSRRSRAAGSTTCDGALERAAARARAQPRPRCTRWPWTSPGSSGSTCRPARDGRRRDRARAAGRRSGRRAAAGEARRARGGPAPAVTLHGDANLRNALQLAGGEVALLDLEHLSYGPGRRRPRPGAGRRCSPRRGPRGPRALLRRLRRGGAHARPRRAALAHGRVACWRASRCPRSAASVRARSRNCARCSTPGRSLTMRPALLFYCQHSVGLGHLMRSYALCERLAERFRVVLLCGGELPRGDRAAGERRADPAAAARRQARRGLRERRPARTRPSARGRSAPSSDPERAARRRSRRSCSSSCSRSGARSSPASSSRCSRRRAPPARSPPAACATSWSAAATTSAPTTTAPARSPTRYLDAVLVHCDPRFARLEETFKPSTPLTVPVHYTGFVAGREPEPAGRARRPHRRLRRRRPRRRAADARRRWRRSSARPPDARRSPGR